MCLFSTLMILTFSRRLSRTWRATTSRFAWSRQMWILSPLQVLKTLPLKLGSTYLSFYTFMMFSIFMYWTFSSSNLIDPFESFNYLGETISWHIFHYEVFWLYPPSKEFLQKGISVQEEDVIYNWTDMSSTMMSKVGKPFWVVK